MRGDDVKKLQQYLNAQGFIIARSGLGSKGNETTLFGPATQRALIAFQRANNIRPASGFLGPITRNFINTNQ
jgi:peptidoglycan hydrolase-like protein with peptidoglycan-binding domain